MRKTLDTRVTIGSFSLNPISDLTLRNIFIGSPGNELDTLIYAHELSVDYDHIWDLFSNKFAVRQVALHEGTLNIHKLSGDTLTNLDLALLKLLPTRDTAKAAFIFDLHQIHGTAFRINVDDEANGTLVRIQLDRVDAEIDTLDIGNTFIHIKDLDLDAPSISVFNRIVISDRPALEAKISKTWNIDVDRWELSNGRIAMENLKKPQAVFKDPIGMDYSHLRIDDLDLRVDSLRIRGWIFKGKDVQVHALSHNGFEIKSLAADEFDISKDGILLDGFELTTPQSHVQNSMSLLFSDYTDFKTFADSVKIDIPRANIHVHMHDLLAIAPGLQQVDFFALNAEKDILLQGQVSGHVNRLKVLGMNASMGGVKLTGDFRSHDLAVKGAQLISLDLVNSSFSGESLKSIFPKMKIPPEFDRVGHVNFTGKYDGYPNDFVAFGTFATSLGKVTLDMNLNTVNGLAKGKYSGRVGFENFDLGTLTGVKDLGRVTLSGRIIEGTGLTTSSLTAEVTGHLNMLQFKNYTYKNARIDGQLKGKLFNGTLDINDPNVDMHFEGIADFRDSVPKLDFVSKIDSIRFKELGLSDEPIYLQGYFDADLTPGELSQIHGSLRGENIHLVAKDHEYRLDSINLFADVDTVTQDRLYKIESDIMSGMIRGSFNPATLITQIHQYLHEKYPSSVDAPKQDIVVTEPGQQRFVWDLTIHDTKHWLTFAGIEGLEIKNGKTSGSFDLDKKVAMGTLDLPELHYGGINVYGSTVQFEESDGTSNAELEIIAADLKENFFFEDVLIQGTATDDSLNIRFKTDDLADIIDQIDMDITAAATNGVWNLSFSPRKLKMLDSDWLIPKGNKLEIRSKYFNIEDFELVSNEQHIRLEDINNKGIKADIGGFDISYLNDLWVNDKFQFDGLYSLKLEIDDLFNIQRMHSTIHIPALRVNNVPYGEWLLNASMDDPKDSVRLDLTMSNEETQLKGEGAYLPPIKSIAKEDQNYLRLQLEATDFPLDFLEFLLGGNIRDTEGSVDMSLSLKGKTNKLDPHGEGKVYNGSTTIDYLGVAYSFHNQSFKITENLIDLTGAKLFDVMGNSAVIRGGLTHRYLRNLGLNATITSDKIIGLDVNSDQNNVFYGTGIGSVYAQFSGTVANPIMQIETTTAKGTHIYIPLTGAAQASDRDFVIFLENGLFPANKITQINLGGIDLTMNMNITEDAIIEIIFDDNTGEVMRGSGQGNLTMNMSRTGNFSMYGRYAISQGDYLFTNFAVVKKPFELLPGGTIQWNGDPYDATLSVQAKYKGLTAPVYTFVQEYLVTASNDVISQSRQRTEVDLTMTLTGSLLHPDISFDIAFPNLTGELKAYTDSKINTLKANENAMFEQVVGLLITRSFLPSTAALNAQDFSKSIDNTLSELISATFSSYLGGLLGNLLPAGKVITSIDFQLVVDVPVGGLVTDNPEEIKEAGVEINLPIQFFNDRLEVNVGGNYVKGSIAGANEYFAGDVLFGYKITPDGRLKIRAFNQNTLTVEGRKNKIGIGIAYKREYNSLGEVFGKKKKKPETSTQEEE